MGQLDGKVAIVTGANTGIGLAIARRFAGEGAAVVMAGRDDEAIARAVADVAGSGGHAAAFHYDAMVEEDADRLAAFAAERFGRLDICVPNAGGTFGTGPLPELRSEDWRRTMALNADATFYLFRAASRVMIPQGHGVLVAISSIASIRTSASLQYAAAKGAVNAMVMNLSVQLARHGIRINGILPGPTDTR
ncbi:MAG: SDR family oxidoreductase, partial [Novosphingobium sp.]|nr:SDR family oxidoreductase [Novosphingobium sp.]